MGMVKSLHIGKKAEVSLMQKLEDCGWSCEKSEGKESKWDVKAKNPHNIPLLFEVKYDIKSQITGNLAIEYYNPKSKVLSGISITSSDIWCFAINCDEILELWLCSIIDLKDYIGRNKPFKTVEVAGDNNASLYLYKKDKLLGDIFYRADNAECNDLKSYLKFYMENKI